MFDNPHGDARQHAPATKRNAGFIIDVLKDVLPAKGHVLEIASGSGEHVIAFAQAMPALTWQPSDPFAESRSSVDAWVTGQGMFSKVAPALDLDMTQQDWHSKLPKTLNAILSINMIHIAPWEACLGLVQGAGQLLAKGELLYTYGPYKKDGLQISESNEDFEGWLKGKSREYGIRDIADVARAAESHGLVLEQEIAMPANNFSLVFKKI